MCQRLVDKHADVLVRERVLPRSAYAPHRHDGVLAQDPQLMRDG
jgi:hypothetical protein